MGELYNKIRFYHFISGVLAHQQVDPLCGKCKAFTNTAERMKEGISALERLYAGKTHTLSGELLHMLEGARNSMARLKPPEDAVGQKKAGNCRMPEGVCFVKLSKAIQDKI